MKNIIGIFKRDLKRLKKNPIALMIIIGLMIMPSLYAWVNIGASWDPYGNTQYMKVAVYSEDEGAIFHDEEIVIGDEIIDELKANDLIGWQFVDEEVLLAGVDSGEYYAGIIVPKDFSQDFLSITTANIKRPTLEYYVNSKINAIAPKITDKGVTTLQEQINQTFISLASEIILDVTKSAENTLEENNTVSDSIKLMRTVSSDMDSIIALVDTLTAQEQSLNSGLDLLDTSLTSFQNTLDSSNDTITNSQSAISAAQIFSDKVNGDIGNSLDLIANNIEDMQAESEKIQKAIANGEENIDVALNILDEKAINIAKTAADTKVFVDKLNGVLPFKSAALTSLSEKLASTNKNFTNIHNEIANITGKSFSGNIGSSFDNIFDSLNAKSDDFNGLYTDYNNNLKPEIRKTTDSLLLGLTSANGLLGNVGDSMSHLQNSISSIKDINGYTFESLENLREVLILSQTRLNENADLLENKLQSEKLTDFVDVITSDPEMAANFLSAPVDIERIEVYPIANYGSAMTPFYTVLCLWVGNMLMMSLIKLHVKEDENITNLRFYEAFFGRGLLFLTVAVMQALIVSLGDIFILGVTMVHPVAFVFLAMFISLIFTTIVYSIISAFGDVGKALVVVLLVLQVAASGGTFPVEMTPLFFKIIHPILPFTYAIGVTRECVGGIYMQTLMQDIFGLLCFVPMSVLIGIILKKHLNKVNEFFEEKLEETELL